MAAINHWVGRRQFLDLAIEAPPVCLVIVVAGGREDERNQVVEGVTRAAVQLQERQGMQVLVEHRPERLVVLVTDDQ